MFFSLKIAHRKNTKAHKEVNMSDFRIIGSVQVKNEDVFVEHAILNILDFCDDVIVADNMSTDKTYEICAALAEKYPKIKLIKIQHPREAAVLLEPYYGTKSWVFGVDGDEIYDPQGLAVMRERLLQGEFLENWCIFGNVLNVINLDVGRKSARGYLAPPSRSMTKLYNFSLILNWVNCPERLLGDEVTFKDGYHSGLRRYLHEEVSWEHSNFRCLHMPFMKRSSNQQIRLLQTRLNPNEINYINRESNSLLRILRKIKLYVNQTRGRDWKNQKYRRGSLVEKDISSFYI